MTPVYVVVQDCAGGGKVCMCERVKKRERVCVHMRSSHDLCTISVMVW